MYILTATTAESLQVIQVNPSIHIVVFGVVDIASKQNILHAIKLKF